LKALVVDDNSEVRTLYTHALGALGECDAAESGEEACRSVMRALEANAPYGLILLDIVMPGMDGIEALRKIREIEASKGVSGGGGAKIIMLSGVSSRKHIMQAFRDQCEAYLVKPVKIARLYEAIASLGITTRGAAAAAMDAC